jgi:hypothetical protein
VTAIPKPDPDANDLAACRRKRRYSVRGAMLRIHELKVERGIAVTKYKCPCCPHWHLTKWGAK